MESEINRKARTNEIGYCGCYCRTCHWYSDVMRKPAKQLLELVKANFEVGLWINEKGGSSVETLKGLEILSKSACSFNCKGGSGWGGCPVRNFIISLLGLLRHIVIKFSESFTRVLCSVPSIIVKQQATTSCRRT